MRCGIRSKLCGRLITEADIKKRTENTPTIGTVVNRPVRSLISLLQSGVRPDRIYITRSSDTLSIRSLSESTLPTSTVELVSKPSVVSISVTSSCFLAF